MPLVTIQTVQDLNRVLSIQQIRSRQARGELASSLAALPEANTPEEHETFEARMMERGRALLTHYARMPTLTEFNASEDLKGTFSRWGATFSVAALMGEVVLSHVRMLREVFHKEHRRLITLLLRELGNEGNTDIVLTLTHALKVNLANTGMDPGEQEKAVYTMMQSLVEVMVLVLTEYGLVENARVGYRLTEAGRRVSLHMIDIESFVADILAAHKQLQSAPEVTSGRSTR